ncbi:hypothetical protein CLV59_104128 [Chitinophaga dinghuensis]|uniref:Uncharacterized protein n=1 Tax=Chitinophaga dinghuensis TaxID=1539050 RepID=A0A327VZV5_9BACT|nr:hypothetical protein [Chitinophaga dinghuensis]RAJ81903.1 hypothetical protein CLV59_104128 [Chitinophaga dinghuensis]
MKINSIYHKTVHSEQDISAAGIANSNELVFLLKTGQVCRYDFRNERWLSSFTIQDYFSYTDGGFDPAATSAVYTLDEITVVVNDFKTHGYIHYPGNYSALHLHREDYHANITSFPIALFRNPEGIPHIIYSKAWNHLQIMNLDTRQLLTAAKSLITEDAEEKHLEFYKTHEDNNKLPWPRPYDYFFGALSVSPNGKYFLSNGWVWGSFGCYNVYDIEDFIQNSRIKEIHVAVMDHSYRAMCWVDDQTVAITCHCFTEESEKDEEDKIAYEKDYYEIQLFEMAGNEAKLSKRIGVHGINIVAAEMRYNNHLGAFVVYSAELGVVIISTSGHVLLQDKSIQIDHYDVATGLMLKTNGKEVQVFQLG